MPSCCAVGCSSNSKLGFKLYRLPVGKRNEDRRKQWLHRIGRDKWIPNQNTRLCEAHFTEDQFENHRADKRRLLKQTAVPSVFSQFEILPGAVPSIFPNSPSFTSSEPSNARENPDDKGKINKMESLKAGTVSLREQVKKEECEQISTIQKPYEKLKSHKSDCWTNKSAIILLPLNANQAPTTISGTESQNVAEMSIVIKQEPIESVDEPPRLVIKKILRTEKMASSSRNSSPSNSASLPENALPFANPDSTNVDETPAAHIPNKPAPKRKINDAEPDTVVATPDAAQAKLCLRTMPSMLHPPAVTSKKSTRRTPNATQAKLCRHTIPSKRNSKLHPPAGTSKKSVGRSTLPNKNGENATREMFQSLLNGSENNPLFGSRTTERPGDLFDVFADIIADKLREMDWDDCAYALRAILDVVFKAGKVQHNSEIKSDISSPNTNSKSSNQE